MSTLLDRRAFVGLAGLVAGGLAASSLAFAAEQGPPTPAAIPPGRIDAAVSALDGLIAELMKKTGVPGMSVAVMHEGKTVYAKGFGVRRLGGSQPVDADTVFQLASVSKSLAATVVARQVGRGVVSWDTPVVKHLPWFKLSDPYVTEHVTIADLFSHRSGLPDHAGDDLEDLGFDRRTILERLRYLPLDAFRASYAYTNFGLTAAAEAVAVASGKDWAELSREELYAPLGMDVTSSLFADFEKQPNRADGHTLVGKGFEARLQRQPDPESPAGGVSSSVNDLAAWMKLILAMGQWNGQELVAPKALLPALTIQSVTGPASSVEIFPGIYGFGTRIGVTPMGHIEINHSGGFALGAGTRYLLIPSGNVGIAVCTNASPSGAAEALTASFSDLAEYGEVTRDYLEYYAGILLPMSAPVGDLLGKTRPADAQAAATASTYVGTYTNSYFGEATVTQTDGSLRLDLGPHGKTQLPLQPWNGDVFAAMPFAENYPFGTVSSVTFHRPTGKDAREVTVEFLNPRGFGTFKRR